MIPGSFDNKYQIRHIINNLQLKISENTSLMSKKTPKMHFECVPRSNAKATTFSNIFHDSLVAVTQLNSLFSFSPNFRNFFEKFGHCQSAVHYSMFKYKVYLLLSSLYNMQQKNSSLSTFCGSLGILSHEKAAEFTVPMNCISGCAYYGFNT